MIILFVLMTGNFISVKIVKDVLYIQVEYKHAKGSVHFEPHPF